VQAVQEKIITGGTQLPAPHLLRLQSREEDDMKLALFAAAAVAAIGLATPVKAQEVIYNPGYCAQFYPNANCQNKGPGNPYTGSYQAGHWQNNYAYMGHRRWHHVRPHHHHHHHH
jgi:hypothetical protein